MKKGFLRGTLTLILLLGAVTCVQAENMILAGYGIDEKFTYSIAGEDETSDITSAISLAYEYAVGGAGLENGFGFQYQMPKNFTVEGEEINFQNIPVYGVIALGVAETEITNTYLVGKLGYNYFKADLEEGLKAKGGLYYAFGLGMKIGPNFRTQMLYEVYNGEVSSDYMTMDVMNKVYSVKCGFAF
jgi:hypothetical protein